MNSQHSVWVQKINSETGETTSISCILMHIIGASASPVNRSTVSIPSPTRKCEFPDDYNYCIYSVIQYLIVILMQNTEQDLCFKLAIVLLTIVFSTFSLQQGCFFPIHSFLGLDFRASYKIT